MINDVLSRLEATDADGIERLCDWLRIASISADPDYRDDCDKAANWAADQLAQAGLDARVLPTGTPDAPGQPIVLATTPAGVGDGGPHVLFYGHYDVQPADPLELWESGPFEPAVRAGDGTVGEHLVARGASDAKGQVAAFLHALRAWHDVSGRPAGGVRMTVLIEGEEESGSENLERFLDEHRAELADCDFCLISDTAQLARGRPAITYGVRGLAYTQVRLHGPDKDVHSGLWGGRLPNPLNELVKVLAGLWDADRRVTIPGFYDAITEPTPEERERWRALGVDAGAALAAVGLPPEADVGEAGWTSVEREWARPTAEINGLWGGYTGAGAKTVIPAHASAKVSFRLVDGQDPARIAHAFFDWLRERTPPGCRWELTEMSGGPPASVDPASPWLTRAASAVEQATGAAPALIKTGGSIPVAGMLKAGLGLETVFMGFALDDDRVHSPNEKFELACYRDAARSHAALIDQLRGGA